jgi:hypothetical protein
VSEYETVAFTATADNTLFATSLVMGAVAPTANDFLTEDNRPIMIMGGMVKAQPTNNSPEGPLHILASYRVFAALSAAIDVSYELLEPEHQREWNRIRDDLMVEMRAGAVVAHASMNLDVDG